MASAQPRNNVKRVLRWVGPAIGVAGVVFVSRELIRHWGEVRSAIDNADLGLLMLGLLVGLASFTWLGGVWKVTLAIAGHGTPLRSAMYQYFVGQLGKYIPGGIWPVVGRAEMARRAGAPGPVSYWATLLAMTLTYLAALIVAAVSLFLDQSSSDGSRWNLVLGLLPLGVLCLHPSVLRFGLQILRRVTGRRLDVEVPTWAMSVGLLLTYTPAWIGIGGSTWLIAGAIAVEGPSLPNIVFATSLAWTVGFLVFPVPGGVGVREAVFIATATTIPSTGLVAAVAVVSRFGFILVDLIGAGVVTAWTRSMSPKSTQTPTE